MAYFMLNCYGPPDADASSIYRIPQFEGVSWNRGSRITAHVPAPVRIHLDPDAPGILLPMYYKGVLLMSDGMLAALRKAGVANLETFEAILVDEAKGQTHSNYKLVNIVGAIAAADLGKSLHTPHGRPLFDVDFDSLSIDMGKARGALMFRLAENVSGIVVHESVKQVLLDEGIPHLEFTPPSHWFG